MAIFHGLGIHKQVNLGEKLHFSTINISPEGLFVIILFIFIEEIYFATMFSLNFVKFHLISL